MVKHVILWKLKDELAGEEKEQVKAGIKEGLEGLAGQIPGLIEVKVRTECLPSSTADVMLDTTFDSVESLKGKTLHSSKVMHALRNLGEGKCLILQQIVTII